MGAGPQIFETRLDAAFDSLGPCVGKHAHPLVDSRKNEQVPLLYDFGVEIATKGRLLPLSVDPLQNFPVGVEFRSSLEDRGFDGFLVDVEIVVYQCIQFLLPEIGRIGGMHRDAPRTGGVQHKVVESLHQIGQQRGIGVVDSHCNETLLRKRGFPSEFRADPTQHLPGLADRRRQHVQNAQLSGQRRVFAFAKIVEIGMASHICGFRSDSARKKIAEVLRHIEDCPDVAPLLRPPFLQKVDQFADVHQTADFRRARLPFQLSFGAERPIELLSELLSGIGRVGDGRNRQPSAPVDGKGGRTVGRHGNCGDAVSPGKLLDPVRNPASHAFQIFVDHALLAIFVEVCKSGIDQMEMSIEDQHLFVRLSNVDDGKKRFNHGEPRQIKSEKKTLRRRRESPCGSAKRRRRPASMPTVLGRFVMAF